MKVAFRQNRPADEAFIFATYLRNRWFDKANKTTLKRSTWSSLQHKRLERLLNEQKVLIACLDEDNDTILGYAFIDDISPYAYVKLAFRSEGFDIKTKLLKELSNGN